MKAQYINPYTDFGFKKLFGEEASKDLLMDFLNQLLPAEHKIVQLSFKNTEQWGDITSDKKAIFDIYCRNEKGDRFIVEMQKAKIKFFKDRTIFYSTFPIKEQADKGEWDFKLNPVYCVAILDFKFEDYREKKDHIIKINLRDQYCQLFSDKLNYIFIEMPRFTKTEEELEDHFDKWLFFLKNLEDFQQIPEILNQEVFLKGFEIARIANFSEEEMAEYEYSLKYYRDLKGVIDTAREEGDESGYKRGKEKGREEGAGIEKVKMARLMKTNGEPLEKIANYTGLTIDELEAL